VKRLDFCEHFSLAFIYLSCSLPQAFISLGLWCAVLPAMMKPTNNIAQGSDGEILNANLYFFSWGSFIMALSIFSAYLHDVYGVGKSLSNKNFKTFFWGALMATSFVTMAAGT
jgi:hypothetical protein